MMRDTKITMTRRWRVRAAAVLLASAGLSAFSAHAAPEPGSTEPPKPAVTKPAPDKPATSSTKPPATATPAKPAVPASGEPTLDDLLGLPTQKPGGTSGTDASGKDGADGKVRAPGDSSTDELDRLLTGKEIGDAIEQAVAMMGDAAERVEGRKDLSLDTQRVQEDIVRKLDQLLASLQKQQQQGGGSSKPSPSNDPAQRQQAQRQQSKAGSSQNKQATSGTGDKEWEGPAKQEGPLRPIVETARSAWGDLPARVRESLMQGAGDKFSQRYRVLTEQYYKRLAEEGGK